MRLNVQIIRKDLDRYIRRFTKRYYEVCVAEYSKLGRECVTDARNKSKVSGGFDDQTGNLRQSIGFILMLDGKSLVEDFQLKLKGKRKKKKIIDADGNGFKIGKRYAAIAGKAIPLGWAIVIVAGMEYASYVEAMGYDVLTGSTLGMSAKFKRAQRNIELTLTAEFSSIHK